MSGYLALLRGINVGGKNIIRMADLRTCFEALGLANVTTYIQSGNVVFSTSRKVAVLEDQIEAALSKQFGYSASVVVLTASQLRRIVSSAPPRFGQQAGRYRYDVLFLKRGLSATAALKELPLAPGVDTAHAGPGALYCSRLTAQASRSRLSRITTMPIYKSMTVRNWNTTTRLLELLG